ncbi:hypothetical protein UA32_12820 [Photobacterium angustum]|uniref:Uncharacterized protein n=1 Tax=Photobacterium angustum TaxID=661 RepID=A0ABX5H0C8_PHOAN|nr:Imm39 family immunity protein [Photobacterium angustum]KJG37390.1 hypothetical protein UA32_12820 [Photobacterium angustum]PSX05908.1 hypothetical protein C0W27_17755 [Photobacterium angustum]
MADQRILLIGGVSLMKGRVKEAGPVMREICDELEPMLQDIGFLNEAPFKTISMIICFGEKDDLTPQYDPINKRHSELPVGVELELAGLRTASKDVVKAAFVTATIDVLLDVSEKYGLPNAPLKTIAGM